MTRQVQRGEAVLAAERAAAIGDALAQAVFAIRVASMQRLFIRSMEAGDKAGVATAVATASQRPGIRTLVITDASGVPIAGSPPDMVFVPNQPETKTVGGGDRDAYLRVTERVVGSSGDTVGWVQATVSVAAIAPRAIAAPALETSIVTVADRTGLVLLTGMTGPYGPRLQSPVLRKAVASGEATVVSYHSPLLEVDRIAAVHPVPGTGWAVVVGADGSVAYEPARSLGIRLLTIFAVSALLLVALVAVIVSLIRSAQRRLREEHALAVAESYLDPLTGVGNRRQLAHTLATVRAQDDSTAIIAVDFDDFKAVNDQCGHAAGDQALRQAADVMLEVTRPVDTVIRLGGDEFIVIMPDTSEATAADTALRIGEGLESIEIPGYGRLAASVGHAAGAPIDAEAILHWADRRLYDEKQRRKSTA